MKRANRPLHANEQQLLSLTLAICAIPHLLEQPWWLAVSLGIILLALSRLSADLRLRLPRYTHIVLGLLVAILVFQAYKTLVGREGGVAVLLALCIVKLVETRYLRDARALILLMFLLTGIAFLHSQELWLAAYSLASTATILYCGQKIEQEILPTRTNTKTTLRLILEGIPIAILLFVLFPRLPAPLWSMPDNNTAKSGLPGDQMSPGSIGNMIQDESIAFRVQFKNNTPAKSAMYWRGPVFEDFDGERWRPAFTQQNLQAGAAQSQWVNKNPAQIIGLGQSYQYSLTLEPHQQNWVLALDVATQTPANTHLSNRLQVLSEVPITERKRFELQAQTSWITSGESNRQIERSLALPAELNPQASALAEQWLNLPTEQRVARALQWLTEGGFSYTLTPPVLTSRHRVDEFLFQSKQGFCEHYASAFTFLMRAAGVPARVVTGYQGATQNGDYWLIRQADAHAWTEVWLESRGWQRVDPTFVISPTRINAGIARSVESSALPFMLRSDNAWVRNLRLKADIVINTWNQWVVGYDQQRQSDFLKKLGIDDFLTGAFLLWLIGGLAVILGSFAAWLIYKNRPPRPDAASQAYRLFSKKLRPILRADSEAPQHFAARASEHFPNHAKQIVTITQLYLKARYAQEPAALRALQREVARFNPQRKS